MKMDCNEITIKLMNNKNIEMSQEELNKYNMTELIILGNYLSIRRGLPRKRLIDCIIQHTTQVSINNKIIQSIDLSRK
jgi:hypothetical protein